MAKQIWKAGNMLYPLPAVLVTSKNQAGEEDVCTVAWAGTVCTNPPMVSISLRKSRLTYDYIMDTGCFVINLTTEQLAWATDYCGVRSGRNENKFETAHLTTEAGEMIDCPLISESPVNIECRVTETKDLGSHTMFIAEVLCVHADDQYMDEQNKFDLSKTKPIVYSHGEYHTVGSKLGTFGYSVRKKAASKKRKKRKSV